MYGRLTGGCRAVSGDGGVQGSSKSSAGVELSLKALEVEGKGQHVSLAGSRAPSACNFELSCEAFKDGKAIFWKAVSYCTGVSVLFVIMHGDCFAQRLQDTKASPNMTTYSVDGHTEYRIH